MVLPNPSEGSDSTLMTIKRLLDTLIPSRAEQQLTESFRLILERVFGRPATDAPSDDALV